MTFWPTPVELRAGFAALLFAAAITLAVVPPVALAQDADAPAEPAQAEPPSEQTAPADQASQQAGTGAAEEARLDLEVFDDWRMECYVPAVAGLNCQITQHVLGADTEQAILVMAIAADPGEDVTRLQLALPLGISVRQPLALEIGPDYRVEVPVVRCTSVGCLLEGTLAPPIIERMRANDAGAVVYSTGDGQTRLRIGFSLDGFAEAFEEMAARNTVAGE